MFEDRYKRTELLLGNDSTRKLHNASVAVFGLGGVGGYAAEALIRSGIGRITLVDGDVVSISNLNRQLAAREDTLGRSKADIMAERAALINSEIQAVPINMFYDDSTCGNIDLSGFDYIIDAIDTVKSKVLLICSADRLGVPIISCMGAGNKLDPTAFRVADIYKTSVCPLARIMRRELKQMGIKSLKTVYSEEMPYKSVVRINPEEMANRTVVHNNSDEMPSQPGGCNNTDEMLHWLLPGSNNSAASENDKEISTDKCDHEPAIRGPVGSLCSVVAAAGMLLANEVILDLTIRS